GQVRRSRTVSAAAGYLAGFKDARDDGTGVAGVAAAADTMGSSDGYHTFHLALSAGHQRGLSFEGQFVRCQAHRLPRIHRGHEKDRGFLAVTKSIAGSFFPAAKYSTRKP